MISTVTTTTVSTVVSISMATSLGLLAIVVLFILLIQKETLTVSSGDRAKVLSRALNVALVPLLLAFALSVAVKLMGVIG